MAWAHLIATVLQRLQVPACVRLPDECTCLVCIGGPFPALTALADYFLACRPHTPTLPKPLLGKFDLFCRAEAAFWASAEWRTRGAQAWGPQKTYRVEVFIRDCPPLDLHLAQGVYSLGFAPAKSMTWTVPDIWWAHYTHSSIAYFLWTAPLPALRRCSGWTLRVSSTAALRLAAIQRLTRLTGSAPHSS